MYPASLIPAVQKRNRRYTTRPLSRIIRDASPVAATQSYPWVGRFRSKPRLAASHLVTHIRASLRSAKMAEFALPVAAPSLSCHPEELIEMPYSVATNPYSPRRREAINGGLHISPRKREWGLAADAPLIFVFHPNLTPTRPALGFHLRSPNRGE